MRVPVLFRAMVASVFLILLIGAVSGVIGAVTPSSITYQGRLLDTGGTPLGGVYGMQFQLYDSSTGGTLLSDSGVSFVTVNDGLFETEIPIDPTAVDGGELWLRMQVQGEWLTPRQPLRAAPFALGLRPGSRTVGGPRSMTGGVLEVEMTGSFPNASGISVVAPATGTALYGVAAGGTGVFASSTGTYAVWGASQNSWGGYFTSQNGDGIHVETNGDDHWDHGAVITSNRGWAVYAKSALNMGVRGEAGDLTGVVPPLGPVGVVGMGQNRGMVGSSYSGTGVYASSVTNYGVWGQSSTYRGVTGRTSRPDNNYGFYTPDNLFASNYNRGGTTSQVVQNGGTEPLEPGDVVVFTGIAPPLEAGGAPIVQVAKAGTVDSQGLAGVVENHFNIASTLESFDEAFDKAMLEANQRGNQAEIDSLMLQARTILPGPIPKGNYLLMVISGAAQVKVSAALNGSIKPGDALMLDTVPGMATRASFDEEAPAVPRQILGKALEGLAAGDQTIYVYLQ